MQREETQEGVCSSPEVEERSQRMLVTQVEKLSPDTLLAGAALSVGLSLFLRIIGRHHDAQFVGQWAPTLLLVGLYAKGTSYRPPEYRQVEGARGAAEQELH